MRERGGLSLYQVARLRQFYTRERERRRKKKRRKGRERRREEDRRGDTPDEIEHPVLTF